MRFDATDWLLSRHVRAMSLEARGAYFDLICRCWLDGSVADPPLLELNITEERWRAIWPQLRPCFMEADGRLVQPRVKRDQLELRKYLKLQAERGRLGGHAKHNRASASL
jgi:uncharacterized protein YdaU (DUF1376 family)